MGVRREIESPEEFRARQDRCIHSWVEVREGNNRYEMCYKCEFRGKDLVIAGEAVCEHEYELQRPSDVSMPEWRCKTCGRWKGMTDKETTLYKSMQDLYERDMADKGDSEEETTCLHSEIARGILGNVQVAYCVNCLSILETAILD